MELEVLIGRYHDALDAFATGDSEPMKSLVSHRDDVTLANPFGPPVLGWNKVSEALDYASSRFRKGRVTTFENLANYVSPDLATILEVEMWEAKVGERDDIAPFVLRVTTTFRREDGDWKIVHRHADPIATQDPQGPLRGS